MLAGCDPKSFVVSHLAFTFLARISAFRRPLSDELEADMSSYLNLPRGRLTARCCEIGSTHISGRIP